MDTSSPAALIANADVALYRAKREDRNRVATAEDAHGPLSAAGA